MSDQAKDQVQPEISRRRLFAAGGIAAAGLTAAACGTKSASPTNLTGMPTASQSDGQPTATGGSAIASVAKVPVGGAEITNVRGQGYVVSQQTAGKVACYSAICPHQGCLIDQIQGTEAVCPCHGSRFNVFSGDLVQGPAETGLTKVAVKVSGGKVVLA